MQGTITPPPAFHVMAKPTGAPCNLCCDYCFFLEKSWLTRTAIFGAGSLEARFGKPWRPYEFEFVPLEPQQGEEYAQH